MALHIYIPQDRLRALARGETLRDRVSGAALFADISGFTALTESFHERLGARQGAEELTRLLGAAYSALIAEVEKFGGSVIGFAGDAMMCWFDNKDEESNSSSRAVTAAFGMQHAIDPFPALGLKIAITSGDARRFVVGDPEIQRLDVLAGATVARTSTAEHQATRGEIVADEATVNALGDSLTVTEWRTDAESNERFAAVSKYAGEVVGAKIETPDSLSNDVLQPWVHRAVFERETSSQVAFLTEFRPCVALFVRFLGIDYDAEDAEEHLDAFTRQIQTSAGLHHGTLLDIIIGDKGSYAYINFGALSAHEDDSRRAVKTALELKDASSLSLQMGITQGMMRVGAYGGETRRTFSALGDDVNLAARLMTTAISGEIILSSHVYKAVEPYFTFEPRPPLPMKGKAEPLPVFAVTDERRQRPVRLQEPTYALPMVGRQSELQIINDKLELSLQGKSQIIGIVAEAGMGKSRLVAEVIRAARRKGFAGYGGACQSDGINTPYLAWKSICGAFFDVDPSAPLRKQIRSLEGEVEDRAPERIEAVPLLGSLLNFNIPENEFTKTLEPKDRKGVLHALIEDCLKTATQDESVLIVVEDLHWIDTLSHDLLEDMARALSNYRVCFVLAYRPPQLTRLQAPRLEALPQFTKIELHELNRDEAEGAIRAKLTQLYPARSGAVSTSLVDKLMTRAQGNPFYLEELLNYLRDRGLDPRDPADLNKIELPDSLHALVLSRIDQLSEREKTTLRVASIVGRLFRAAWLTGYYPALGDMAQVKVDLDQLEALDITPLASEPELAYLFKHIVTHEVTYESLPFTTRAQLHEQLAMYLEGIAAPVDMIAHHYGQSHNQTKQREYWQKAGEAAQEAFANEAALEYYGKLLPLLTDRKDQTQIHMQRGEVLQLTGKSDEAESEYRAALVLAQQDVTLKAGAQLALGKLNRIRGDFAAALEWLAQAKEARTELQDRAGLAQVLIEMSMVLFRKGENVQAREPLNEGLALAREVGDKLNTALALSNLGNVARNLGDYPEAQALYEESLALRREIGNKRGVSDSIYNLGTLAYDQGRLALARELYEESVALDRGMGHKWNIITPLGVLGSIAWGQGDLPGARAFYEESLALCREIGAKYEMAFVLVNLGVMIQAQGDEAAARELCEESLALRREMGDKWGIAVSLAVLGQVVVEQGDYPTAQTLFDESLALNHEMDYKWGTALTLSNLGYLRIMQGNYAGARAYLNESLGLYRELGIKSDIVGLLPYLGMIALEQGEYPAARAAYVEGLKLSEEIGVKQTIVLNLNGLAALAAAEGMPERAARLAAAAETPRVSIGVTFQTADRRLFEHTIAAAKESLGEQGFQSAWEVGTAMTLEQAVKFALE